MNRFVFFVGLIYSSFSFSSDLIPFDAPPITTQEPLHQFLPLNFGSSAIPTRFYSENFCQFILDTAQEEIIDTLLLLQDPGCPIHLRPKKLLLYGPSGSGKTTLAQVIACVLRVPCLVINAGLLGNEYKNSTAQNLQRAIAPFLYVPCVIVIDEIDCIIKQGKNDKDPDIDLPKQIWEILDLCQTMPNILLIGTTNDLTGMPEPLRTRFAGDTIEIPLISDAAARKKIIEFQLSELNQKCDSSYLNSLIKKTKSFSHRELEKLVHFALAQAYLRNSANPTITSSDFDTAIARLQKSRKALNVIQWSAYEKHLQYGLQIAGLIVNVASLITSWRTFLLSYALSLKSHELQKDMGEKSHQGQMDGLKMQEKGLSQGAEQFNSQQKHTVKGLELHEKGLAQGAEQAQKSLEQSATQAKVALESSEKIAQRSDERTDFGQKLQLLSIYSTSLKDSVSAAIWKQDQLVKEGAEETLKQVFSHLANQKKPVNETTKVEIAK